MALGRQGAVTSHDVARLAGVSQPTVSRALRDRKGVSTVTRVKVREAARALGYVPSNVGRSLATRTTGRVGVVTDELYNPFYPALIEPLHDALAALGYGMILVTDRGDVEVEIEPLIDGSLDGVVLSTSAAASQLPFELARRGLPYVMVNRTVDGAIGDECVSDNVAGAEAVADLLVDLGHTRIGAVFGPEATSTGRERAMGFRRRLAERGVLLPGSYVWSGHFHQDTGRTALRELLDREPRPTALFCANDVIAFGVCSAAVASGIAIPAELTVVGFDDIPMASWEVFSLTTMRVDLVEMGQRAAALLGERIATPGLPPRRIVLPVGLVKRSTHAPPAT
jgi:LacI family transcriptional regulator